LTREETFIIELAHAMQQFGIPSHRLENSINDVLNAIGVQATVIPNPEYISITFFSSDKPFTINKKSGRIDINFDRIVALSELVEKVIQKEISVDQALLDLTSIHGKPILYSKLVNIFSISLSSISAACVFGGGYNEMFVSGVIGLFVGIINVWVPHFSKISLLLSAAFAIVFSQFSVSFLGPYSIEIASITGLILLIPGFTLSLAISELAHSHAQSGTIRLAQSVISFVMMAVGIGLGYQLVSFISFEHWSSFHVNHPTWLIYLALLLIPAGFLVLFNALPKHYPWIFLACLISYFSLNLFDFLTVDGLTIFFSALTLGLMSNAIARWKKLPVSLMLVPGIILLVPGSIGFKSLSYLVNNQTLTGIDTAFSTIIAAVALASGLLFSNILLNSKQGF
jgi:uncharacterized membrane protein YjjP (DUF1212 family)